MRKTTILLTILTAVLSAATAFANHIGDTYVIPVVSDVTGAFGSRWMSDVAITNFQPDPLTVQLIVIETGENMPDNIFPLTTSTINGSVTVPANNTVVLRNVLAGHRGKSNVSGALLLGADRPFAVTSRSYNSMSGGVGSTVTPVRDFLENSTGRSDNTAVAYLPGLVNNGTTRTNIGLVIGTGSTAGPLGVEVRVRNAVGAVVGTRLFIVPSGSFTHVQFPISSITNTMFDIGSADVQIVGGSGSVVPYASVIDNSSGSASYVMGQFPNSAPIAPSSASPNVFRDLLFRWRSAQ